MMFLRLAVVALSVAASVASVAADPSSLWADEPFWDRPSARSSRVESLPEYRPRRAERSGEAVRDGGLRPAVAPQAPPIVPWRYAGHSPGSIVIDSGGRKLYFVLPGERAFQYPISVGREGFAWAGTERISRKQAWPDWHPPAEMRKRDPKLPVKMTGGLKNPLGAMALYLGNTLYRIHGTNDEKTIGHASSSGCFRMMNSAVLHLSQFAQVGTPVTVVNGLPDPPQPPVARRQLEPAPPSVARRPLQPPDPPVARRPLEPMPPVATNRPAREPEPNWPPVAEEEDYRDAPPQPRRRFPPPRREDDIADVRVTPDHVDDYDPYAVRRPYPNRRYARQGYRDREFDTPYDDYSARRPGERIWYDDERDDY
jgi:lipoprotein-anchoring transpeptidase ErfK/SrfK